MKWFKKLFRIIDPPAWEFVSMSSADADGEHLMTVNIDGQKWEFYGSCTLWYSLPRFTRVGNLDARDTLHGFWKREQYRLKYARRMGENN
jgi:hypothetical protein